MGTWIALCLQAYGIQVLWDANCKGGTLPEAGIIMDCRLLAVHPGSGNADAVNNPNI